MKQDGCRKNKADMAVEADGQGSTSPPQSFLPQSSGYNQPGSSETPPSSTVIVKAAKSVHTLSPSQLTSLQKCSYPPSGKQGALQNSSVCLQGSSEFRHVPLVSSTLNLQASQSESMDQMGKEPSPVPPCERGSRLKLDCQTPVLQPSPCSPRASPLSNSLGPDPSPTPPRFQSPLKTTNFQPTPPTPPTPIPLHTTGLRVPVQIPAVLPPTLTSGVCPPLQMHRLNSATKTLSLQISPYNPSLQSLLGPSRFHLLSLPEAIQPSTFALRLQTVGPPSTPHLPELRPPPGVHRLQPSPPASVAQIATHTPGLLTPRNPGVQPPLQFPEPQAPSYGEELHIVQLSKSVQQVRAKGQRKYVCGECGRDCAKRSALEKHVRSHTGERPFPCATCRISFKTQSNLYKHNRTQSHLHNCQVSAELERSSRPEPSATSSSESLVKDTGPCEARGNCHTHLRVASSRSNTKHQNLVRRDISWCVVSATEKSEDSTVDGEKQGNVQPQPGHIGNRHLVLQRQQATYFAKRWVNKSSSSSVQTNESTDSGYLSHSDSPDQPLLVSGSLQSLQRQSTDSESERSSQPVRPLSNVGRSALGSAGEEGRTTRRSQELGEWISKLISDNKAVVDDKHLETVRPRRTLNSKQGSIDLPMPYTFKDSFHFDMKSVQVNKKPRGASSLPAFSNQLRFYSLPEQISSTADCLPVIRSNSVPLSKGGFICGNMASSSSGRPYELQRNLPSMLLVTSSQSHSLEFPPMHHRTLVRQTALEGSPAGILTAERPAATPGIGSKVCDSKARIPKPNCKSLGKNDSQKRLKKFSHERWSMYGEETFRKKYQETKRATHSAGSFASVTWCRSTVTAPSNDTSALPGKTHSRPLVAPSAHKIPVKKHFSDPLPLGSVKVTTFNSPGCEVRFSQIDVDQRSPLRRHPDPCGVATETKTARIPDHVVEAPAITTPISAETLPTAERTGEVTASCAAPETAGDTEKKAPLHQQSATASRHIEKDVTRPMLRHFSHPKLVRQLSILVSESKASSQQTSKSNEFSLQQGENNITEFPSGQPPSKRQRLKLSDTGQLAERQEFGSSLSTGAAVGKSHGSCHVFDPDTSHQQCQIIREEGCSDQQPLPPAASGSSTASPDCSRSLPTATSTSLPLYFRPLLESRSKEREVISQRGFPTQLQTSGNELYHTSSNLHLGPTLSQLAALVSPQAGTLHLQKQDFLPKYQLKWTKKEPSISSHPPP